MDGCCLSGCECQSDGLGLSVNICMSFWLRHLSVCLYSQPLPVSHSFSVLQPIPASHFVSVCQSIHASQSVLSLLGYICLSRQSLAFSLCLLVSLSMFVSLHLPATPTLFVNL